MDTQEFDIIAIGDIVTDAFIRLKQASVYYDDIEHEEKICLSNGAKIPYEFAKIIPGVGNGSNAAIAATKFGLKAALVTDLGDDDNGKEILEALERNGVDQSFVRIHENTVSNYHYVLWYKTERTILVKHHEYDYKFPAIGNPSWVYLTSIGEHSMEYHYAIIEYIRSNPGIRLAFQPGTFQIKLGLEKLRFIYELTDVFFCNLQEAQYLLQTQDTNIARLAQLMCANGPKISIITNGREGAYMSDKENVWFLPIYPNETEVLESTGAGDSFSSTFISALALGKTLEEAFVWGMINSMSVIRQIGSQEGLLTREQVEEFVAKKPEGYVPQKVEV